jgi:hypothetical protein
MNIFLSRVLTSVNLGLVTIGFKLVFGAKTLTHSRSLMSEIKEGAIVLLTKSETCHRINVVTVKKHGSNRCSQAVRVRPRRHKIRIIQGQSGEPQEESKADTHGSNT